MVTNKYTSRLIGVMLVLILIFTSSANIFASENQENTNANSNLVTTGLDTGDPDGLILVDNARAANKPNTTAKLPYSASGTITANYYATYSGKAWYPNSNGNLRISGTLISNGNASNYYCTVYLYDLDQSSYSKTVYNKSSSSQSSFSWDSTVTGLKTNHRYYLLVTTATYTFDTDVTIKVE